MKRLWLILIIGINFASAANASIIYYSTGFEDIPVGSYPSIVYPWVEFTNNMGALRVRGSIPGPDFSGSHSVLGANTHKAAERNIADILIPGVRSVSVVMGDYNADSDPLYLEAYNAFSQLIGNDYELLPSSVYGGPTLSVSTSEDIAYVHFYSGQPYPGSFYFDNFTVAAVPEPATLALLGLGSLVLTRKRKV